VILRSIEYQLIQPPPSISERRKSFNNQINNIIERTHANLYDGNRCDGRPVSETENQLHSPPDSHKDSRSKRDGSASDSELSDLEEPEEDIGVVEPDHYADDGRVPVFKPTVAQFKSFTRYVSLPALQLMRIQTN